MLLLSGQPDNNVICNLIDIIELLADIKVYVDSLYIAEMYFWNSPTQMPSNSTTLPTYALLISEVCYF